MAEQDLLIISCSERKKQSKQLLPAIELYDGPAYRVLRKRLNDTHSQPTIWVLSAKHGLIWADSHIYGYDEQLNKERIQVIRTDVESFIKRSAPLGKFKGIFIWAGKQYLAALPPSFLARPNVCIAQGSIGQKLRLLKDWCTKWQTDQQGSKQLDTPQRHVTTRLKRLNNTPLSYFIPDWDDYLDPEYDFIKDRFSWESSERVRRYAHELFGRRPLYDGIVVSLGHIIMGKGFARNGLKPDVKVMSSRKHLHLKRSHILMGDCGAFSYRRHVVPPFSTEQVVKLYKALRVDIGASIDHIPFGEVEENGKSRPLNNKEIEGRIELTTKLGREFITAIQGASKFVPMGVIQARSKEEYASIAKEYVKAGYQYIAFGGLVPRKDNDILQIVEATVSALEQHFPMSFPTIRMHLFGVLRENLLPRLKQLGITSLDSGSYLRKAWLRSDKNYLSASGEWYSAIRVPYSSDPRFQKNATGQGISIEELRELEGECLKLLRDYDKKREGLSNVLDRVVKYDSFLLRTSDTNDLKEKYKKTLGDAPWDNCNCPVCKTLGIDVIIFRGFNRNKRRGFHNTWIFYKQLRSLRR